jgi:hypothetical protein
VRGGGSVTPQLMQALRSACTEWIDARHTATATATATTGASAGASSKPPSPSSSAPASPTSPFSAPTAASSSAKKCALRVRQHSTVQSVQWVSPPVTANEQKQAPAAATGEASGEWRVVYGDGSSERFDRIWLATGCELDVAREPYLQSLFAFQPYSGSSTASPSPAAAASVAAAPRSRPESKGRVPLEVVNGLPCLTADLRVSEGVRFYFIGGYAALRVGPYAANLMGGTSAARQYVAPPSPLLLYCGVQVLSCILLPFVRLADHLKEELSSSEPDAEQEEEAEAAPTAVAPTVQCDSSAAAYFDAEMCYRSGSADGGCLTCPLERVPMSKTLLKSAKRHAEASTKRKTERQREVQHVWQTGRRSPAPPPLRHLS